MPAQYNFPEIEKNDTFLRRNITITADGTPLDLTDAVVTMQLKSNHRGKPVHTFNISIDNPTSGVLTLEPWHIKLEPYNYLYDLDIELNNGQKFTFMNGVFPIKNTIG